MIERDLDIDSPDGAMNAFVAHPDEGGPFPVVFLYMDAPGKREELHEMARRIAVVGYFVVLPNLYYRKSRDYQLKERTETGFGEMFEMMGSLSAATTICDTAAMLDFVDAQPDADAKKVGLVGYCMSGPFVMWAAAHFPERVACLASIHGANLKTDADDSPHLVVPRIRCESYFACAETDRWAPPEHIDALRTALVASGTPFRIEWFPGVEHGFVFPQREGIYHKESADRHWERLFALFARNLH
jgi:carboxymethylenebutenolidase